MRPPKLQLLGSAPPTNTLPKHCNVSSCFRNNQQTETLAESQAPFVFLLYTSVPSFIKIRASLLELSSGNQLRTRKLKRPPGGVNVGGIRRKSKASFVFPLYTSLQSFVKIRASLLELSSGNQLWNDRPPARRTQMTTICALGWAHKN